jgi:hypothetical protein
MVLGSRASCKFSCQPNLLNQFIFCFHQICSQHTLIQCHEKNYGFLEDARAGSELILLPVSITSHAWSQGCLLDLLPIAHSAGCLDCPLLFPSRKIEKGTGSHPF